MWTEDCVTFTTFHYSIAVDGTRFYAFYNYVCHICVHGESTSMVWPTSDRGQL